VKIFRVGVMIEVPSAVFLASTLAERVDFLSVGTNDLTRYLHAIDRNNARVTTPYDGLHTAVLNAINHVIKAAHLRGKPVCVCGELADDPAGVLLLLGMGGRCADYESGGPCACQAGHSQFHPATRAGTA
jgi:phosphotransferase system enzyme I (PtsP)